MRPASLSIARSIARNSLAALLISAGLVACGGGSSTDTTSPTTPTTPTTPTNPTTPTPTTPTAWRWEAVPVGYPLPVVPADNPMSAAKVDLGRFLFYDKRLSANGTMACASCHQQSKAFAEGLARSIGSTGEPHPRNAQSLTNVAYNSTLTWVNPTLFKLEEQMKTPLFGTGPIEMGVVNDNIKQQVLARIQSDSLYTSKFQATYSGQTNPITWDNIIKAISAFQANLISFNSKFDQVMQGKATFTGAEERGRALFNNEKAECFHCHGGTNFNDQFTIARDLVGNPINQTALSSGASATSTDSLRSLNRLVGESLFRPLHGGEVQTTPFHNTGQYNLTVNGVAGNYPAANQGKFLFTNVVTDKGRFRAPSLRNVALTAPYMHDGSVATLEEVVAIYAAGGRVTATGPNAGDGRSNPNRSSLISAINLTAQEQADIVAFLKTLTDTEFVTNSKHSNPFPN